MMLVEGITIKITIATAMGIDATFLQNHVALIEVTAVDEWPSTETSSLLSPQLLMAVQKLLEVEELKRFL